MKIPNISSNDIWLMIFKCAHPSCEDQPDVPQHFRGNEMRYIKLLVIALIMTGIAVKLAQKKKIDSPFKAGSTSR